MTVRGPITSLPLVAEPEEVVTDQSLIQTARFDDPDSFPVHQVFRGPVTLTQSARFDDPDTFFAHALAGGTVVLAPIARFDDPDTFFAHAVIGDLVLTQIARFDDANTFFTHIVVGGATPTQSLTQTARFDDPDIFFSAVVVRDFIPPEPEHPDHQVGFPPDGSQPKGWKKTKPKIRIKWRDTVGEAEAKLLEEQRLAEMAQLKAFEDYLVQRRKLAAAIVLLMS